LVEYGGVGSAVAGAGDFNGDRRGDVLLSAIGEGTTGRVYVVPGRRSTHTVTLRGRTSKVFTVERGVGDELAPLAAAGDVNRDGRADILLGSPDYVRGCGERGANGAAYVVFGQRRPMALSATDLRRRGFRINGTTSRFLGDEALSGAGDFNGDRQADLLLPGIDRQLGHLTFSVVTGRPSRLTKERERTCLLLGIAERSTRRILSRGGLPVRVGLRDVRASGYRVDLSARATGRQTRPRRSSRAAPVPAPPPLVARATIRLERPGTRPAVLRLTRAGRRLLLRRGTMRLKLSAKQAGGQRHEKAIVVQLRP
jgi:hypothetical protein